ncbi:hypothetical protein DFQ26_009599 [Actinomortierella ambigua]|nr:hypothetical protein DFQ26_009599 [Actinomortierella ambigua]
MRISSPDLLQIDLGHLVNNESRYDIKILVGQGKAVRYGHSQKLAARCPYFDAALQPHWKESSDGVFVKPNIEPEVFDILLRYLYTGEMTASPTLIPSLIDAALELQLTQLAMDCDAIARKEVNAETVFPLMSVAYRHSLDKLWSTVTECFDINAECLLQRDEVLALESDVLVKALSRDSLVANELTLWKVIVRYAYRQNGMDHKICPLLRFPAWPGRMKVKVLEDETGRHVATNDYLNLSSDDDTSSTDEDAEKSVQKTTRTRTSAVYLRREQYRSLCATVQTLLPAIRFASMKATDFVRYVEGTRLIPIKFCRRVYWLYSMPLNFPNDFAPPRCNASTLLPLDPWLTLMNQTSINRSWYSAKHEGHHSKLKILYLASAHGFSAKAFHERCDDQGPTLTIASTDKNVFIGGFNGMPWSSDCSWRSTKMNFIFQYKAGNMASVASLTWETL